MGPHLMDQNFQTLRRNKDSFIERSYLGLWRHRSFYAEAEKEHQNLYTWRETQSTGSSKGQQNWQLSCSPHPWTKQTPDQLMFGRELHGKLPKRIVPTKEVSSDKIWQWDTSEKKRVRRQKDCNWGHSPFETEQSWYVDPSIWPLPLHSYRFERDYGRC